MVATPSYEKETVVKLAVMRDLNTLMIEERPTPEPGPGQVAIDIRSVGICGSDAAYLNFGRIGPWVVEGPLVLGHETSGVIAAVGEGVTGLVPGDRVAVEPGVPCRQCRECRRGDYHLCPELQFMATPPYDGCLAERIVIDHACAWPIPEEMSFDQAALVEPASVGLWACQRARLKPGESVLVTGAGPVGILAALTAKALGAGSVTIRDVSAQRLDVARRCGLRAEVVSHESPMGRDTDVLIECSANAEALVSGIRRLRQGGRAALVGVPKTEMAALPLAEMVPHEISIHLIHRYAHTWPAVIDLISSGRVPTDHLITHHYPLSKTSDAFSAQHADPDAVKVMIHPTVDTPN
jgi:L-iditol 2-dehydrogenase